MEQLALAFPSEELAQNFKTVFQEITVPNAKI